MQYPFLGISSSCPTQDFSTEPDSVNAYDGDLDLDELPTVPDTLRDPDGGAF